MHPPLQVGVFEMEMTLSKDMVVVSLQEKGWDSRNGGASTVTTSATDTDSQLPLNYVIVQQTHMAMSKIRRFMDGWSTPDGGAEPIRGRYREFVRSLGGWFDARSGNTEFGNTADGRDDEVDRCGIGTRE